jgi:hypothetical protein
MELSGVAIVQYIVEKNGIELPTRSTNKRLKPSILNQVREALYERTTRAASNVLKNEGVDVTMRNVG